MVDSAIFRFFLFTTQLCTPESESTVLLVTEVGEEDKGALAEKLLLATHGAETVSQVDFEIYPHHIGHHEGGSNDATRDFVPSGFLVW